MSGPTGALGVVVRRGGVVEARHRVHAVAVREGGVVAQAGDAELVSLLRSAAKPFQALPVVRAAGELTDEEVAIACASHLADEAQLAAVRALLGRAGATEDELECGEAGRPPSRLRHNCSGKHAAMLLLCRVERWQRRGYRLPEHPVQRAAGDEVARASGLELEALPTATDGCGVVTWALPLRAIAAMWSRLEGLEGGARVATAMRARPELIRGAAAADTRLMREAPGWTAKGGAEGLLCASGPGGLGVALKVEDGATRALGPAAATVLARLGVDVSGLAVEPVRSSRGEQVGEIVSLP